LALEVDGWGTIRCKEIRSEDYGYMICIAEMPGGSTMEVLPRCALDEEPNEDQYYERAGSEPNLLLCGEGPDELGAWDEIVCVTGVYEGYESGCAARRGDWTALIAPECELSMFGEEISSDDPRFISCASDLSVWDEVRCYWESEYEEVTCAARQGLYWLILLTDCRTQDPNPAWTEVDPATVGCDVFY